MKRIIISLFDRQRDYGTVKDREGTSPSVALARHPWTMNTERYILLFQKGDKEGGRGGYREAAESLGDDIRKACSARDREDPRSEKRKQGGDSAEKSVPRDISIKYLPVDYGKDGDSVWDITAASKAIDAALAGRTKDIEKDESSNNEIDKKEKEINKKKSEVDKKKKIEKKEKEREKKELESEKKKLGKKVRFRLYVNLVNGTADQRTALALWAFHMVHSLPSTCECFFACPPEGLPEGQLHSHEQLQFINAKEHGPSVGFFQGKFGTKNAALRSTLDRLERLLGRISIGLDDVILLTGPSGAGKTLAAQMCMKLLQSLHPEIKEENCVHINMASIPENLFESELFGHCKGAYTGATTDKEGLVAKANGGVLFLDEIGELPLHLQSKLLTFLDTGLYRKVGATDPDSSHFLLICGTNRDLENAIPSHFRRDLLERINMWHFAIPGLRDRPEDLEPALRRELAIWNTKKRSGVQFATDAKKSLLAHLRDLPLEGNYRELHAIVRRLATFAEDNVITLEDVKREVGPKASVSLVTGISPQLNYDRIDLAQLAAALDVCRTSRNGREAGDLLFAATKARSQSFNGSAYFQRVFAQFGLKVRFKDGKFDTIERL